MSREYTNLIDAIKSVVDDSSAELIAHAIKSYVDSRLQKPSRKRVNLEEATDDNDGIKLQLGR